MLLATHVDVPALAKDKKCQPGKDNEAYSNLPHTHFL
jgi:hypothetical protein